MKILLLFSSAFLVLFEWDDGLLRAIDDNKEFQFELIR